MAVLSNLAKYDSKYFLSPSAPQNITGIFGNGFVLSRTCVSDMSVYSLKGSIPRYELAGNTIFDRYARGAISYCLVIDGYWCSKARPLTAS
jgi:hypothetical protein